MTTAEAAAVLAADRDADLARWVRPDLIPFDPPPATWRLPVDPNKQAQPDRNEDCR